MARPKPRNSTTATAGCGPHAVFAKPNSAAATGNNSGASYPSWLSWLLYLLVNATAQAGSHKSSIGHCTFVVYEAQHDDCAYGCDDNASDFFAVTLRLIIFVCVDVCMAAAYSESLK